MACTRKAPYTEAKQWAQRQDPPINGARGWRNLSKAGLLPGDLPAWPQGYYKDEFESWGEFLGTGTIGATRRQFKSYTEAKRWAQSLTPKIESKAQWYALSKKGEIPTDVPKDPRNHYSQEFEGWGKFLGTDTIAPQCRVMLSYQELKKWVKDQSPIIYSRNEYYKRVREVSRDDIPSNPLNVYKDEFEGWSTFLGTRTLSSTSLIERMLKQELATLLPVNIASITRMKGSHGKLVQVDISIPSWNLVLEYDGQYFHKGKEQEDQQKALNLCQAHPPLKVVRIREHPLKKISKNDLIVQPNLGPLLLTKKVLIHLIELNLIPTSHIQKSQLYLERTALTGETIIGAKWRTYDEARKWARSQKIITVTSWRKNVKMEDFLPADIPAAPQMVYGGEFLGWSDFLGVDIVAPQVRQFQTYEQAKKWAMKNQVATGIHWGKLSKQGLLPKDLPSNPQATYKREWKGWGAFLDNGKPTHTPWADLKEIRQWCNAQEPPVHTDKQWKEIKNTSDFPRHFPKSIYYHFGSGVFDKIVGLSRGYCV